ncbi:hypothetical protein Droror1_Dr00015138 [Drosera rotundifolia]
MMRTRADETGDQVTGKTKLVVFHSHPHTTDREEKREKVFGLHFGLLKACWADTRQGKLGFGLEGWWLVTDGRVGGGAGDGLAVVRAADRGRRGSGYCRTYDELAGGRWLVKL